MWAESDIAAALGVGGAIWRNWGGAKEGQKRP